MGTKIEKFPPSAMPFTSSSVIGQVKINTEVIENLKNTLYKEKEGLCDVVKCIDTDVKYYKRNLKFFWIAVGSSISIVLFFLGLIVNQNISLIKDVATLMAKLGGL